MPAIQNIVPRSYAMQYDGTNAQDIADLVNDHFQQLMYSKGQEDNGTLTLISHNSAYDSVTMATGDYMIIPDALPCTATQFAYRYTVLPA